MKKAYLFIITAIIMAMPDMAKAQNEYRQAVKELLENNPQYSAATKHLSSLFPKMLTTINQKILVNKADTGVVTEKYLKEQMMDDLYDIFIIPPFAKSISLEEIRQANAILNTPEGKVYMEKSQAMQQSLITNFYGELMRQMVAVGGESLKQGKLKLEAVQPHPSCTEEYKKVFNIYFEANKEDINETFKTLKESPIIKKKIGQEADAENKKKQFEQMLEYINDNIKTMLLNACHETLSIDELRFGVMIYEKPVFSKIRKIGKEFTAYGINKELLKDLSMKWLEKYASWLKKQNIEINDLPK